MNDSSPEQRLANIALFSGLSKRQIKRLVGESKEVDHGPGHVIAEEGLGALAFHLILEGEVAVKHGDKTIRTLGPGEYFGEISIIDGKPRSATVEAATQLRTLAIRYQSFQTLLDDDPTFARALLGTLCARLREAESRT